MLEFKRIKTSLSNINKQFIARNPCYVHYGFVAHGHKSGKAFEVLLAQEEASRDKDLLWFAG